MDRELPQEIRQVELFLRSQGLALQEDSGFREMDNRLIRYADSRIQVRLVCDRGQEWFIEIHDPLDHQDAWRAMASLRSLLTGSEDVDLPLREQVEVLERFWTSILDRLSERNAPNTHAQLDALYEKRLKRMLPKLFQ